MCCYLDTGSCVLSARASMLVQCSTNKTELSDVHVLVGSGSGFMAAAMSLAAGADSSVHAR